MMTSDWPRMAICFLTDANSPKRTEYALRSVTSVSENLIYPNRAWYVALDGTSEEHMKVLLEALAQRGQFVFGTHAEKIGPGPSWNRALNAALEQAEIILWLENDWELQETFDITRYVRLLLEREAVGMVRLGHMAVGLDLHSVGHDGTHYVRIEKSQPYCYSGNPSIRHRCYFEVYGGYPESAGLNPGECELWHDNRVRSKDGPEIWWPLDLKRGGWGAGFGHIGQEQSY